LPQLVRLYRRAALGLSGTSMARVRANRTLVNSGWVAQRYRDTHGVPAETLHPPAVGPFPDVPWEARENGVVCIGRLSPEKRLEVVIEIVDQLRARGHPLHLHLVGTPDNESYTATVRRLGAERADWATLHERLSRQALCGLIARQRYGLHGMLDEHFGMAVAELVSAGCIVLVPDGGGQREIVGADPRLLYRSVDEGADRLAAVIGDPALQAELRRSLVPRAETFTPAHFSARVRRDLVSIKTPQVRQLQ
jgi:glycosyltransferase involved in cell wall biosynthesis